MIMNLTTDRISKRNKVFAYNVPEVTLPTTLKVLFKLIQFTLSLDFGVYKYKTFKMKCVAKVLTLAGCLAASAACVSLIISNIFENQLFFGWYTLFVCQYTIVIFMFTFNNGMTFIDYKMMLLRFDAKYQIDSNVYHFNIKIVLVVVISVTSRLFLCAVYCIYSTENCIKPWYNQLLFFPWLSLDIVLIMNMFLFYATYCRLAKFPSLFENPKNVVPLRNSYKLIVDSLEKTKKSFDAVVSMSNLFFFYNTAEMLNLREIIYIIYGPSSNIVIANE